MRFSVSFIIFPDVLNDQQLQSLSLNACGSNSLSFRLLDEAENLVVETAGEFAARLGCDVKEPQFKVSGNPFIFGNAI